jgi:hypothetical protein
VVLREVAEDARRIGGHFQDGRRKAVAGGALQMGEGQVGQMHLLASCPQAEVERQPTEHVEAAAGARNEDVLGRFQFGKERQGQTGS